MTPDLHDLHTRITREIVEDRQRESAASIAAKRADARRAEARAARENEAFSSMGIDLANLEALDREMSAEANSQRLEIEAEMDSLSHAAPDSGLGGDIDLNFLPEGATLVTPSWVAAFSDDDMQSELTSAAAIDAQTVLGGGVCKNYWNSATGAGSGIAGTGEGKIQSWIDFGFWFRPPQNRFYSIRPFFRLRGYVIVRADDSWYNSKYARVVGSAWTNVHQYNWKGWNHVDLYNDRGDNININVRRDIDRYTYNSYLLGANDWAYIRCTIGLYAYARGGGSYAKNDFSTGNANYLCVPHVVVV